MLVRLEQPENVSDSSSLILLEIVAFLILLQPLNAPSPNSFTLSGITTLV